MENHSAEKARLLFITDPLCSWCWGTLPEMLASRKQLAEEVSFDLVMGGLQVGGREGLAEYNKRQLLRLWKEVRQVTGQVFSERFPTDFVYHSEIACRAVEIARQMVGEAPWAFFGKLQAAFYVNGLDITQTGVLAPLLGIAEDDLDRRLVDAGVIEATRANFALAESLSANALPGVFMDTGQGPKLVSGGYITAEFLVPDLRRRMAAV